MESQQLNIVFLPYPTPGHMIPMIDTARLFAKHGANVTIITTHANVSSFQKAIDSDFSAGHSIKTQLIQFPSAQVGLPDGVENIKDGTSLEMLGKITRGIWMLQDQIEILFQDLEPDCIVTDMMYPWTVQCAAKLGIPRLHFYSSSYFSNCACHFIRKCKPHEGLVSDTNKFTIPGLPHSIQMTTLQLPDWMRNKSFATGYFEEMFESEERSYGTICNSFHELESDYEKLCKTIMGIKCWSIGPVSAWANKDDDEKKANRGHMEINNIGNEQEWLNWLNSKPNDSVLYVSFGSLTRLPHLHLVEIAHGLENSGHNFIWVVRKKDRDEGGNGFLQEFEKRMKESDKGYIIWNWAPQLLILDHPATGGIVTHCGWNSILESLNAGLPMIAWPVFAEQFYNEKLVTEILKIGVPVGVKENKLWASFGEEAIVRSEEIVKAVEILMGSGQDSKEMRMRAKMLGDAAKRTIEEGGHSYNNLIQLIDELKSLKKSKALAVKEDYSFDGWYVIHLSLSTLNLSCVHLPLPLHRRFSSPLSLALSLSPLLPYFSSRHRTPSSPQTTQPRHHRCNPLRNINLSLIEITTFSSKDFKSKMESQQLHNQLNVIFLPFPTPGHMIPMIDTARLFAKHGANVTIITTHANASTFQKSIDNDFNSGHPIKTQLIQFPSAQVGLPDGVENLKDATSPEIISKISRGISMLQDHIENLFQDLEPDCIVTDMCYPWTVESAAKLGIPRLYFYSSSYFSNCASYFVRNYRPHDSLVSDTQKFTIPCLPHTIEMTPFQLADWIRVKNSATSVFDVIFESEKRSYGTIYNSFHELESDYEKLGRTTIGIKSWSVGPVSAFTNNDDEKKDNKGHIGKEAEWLNWLNSKENESVLYVSFGSLTRLSHAQIVELAYGLENSSQNFIWVIRKKDKDEDGESFLEDFEERMKESKKGYIIWNWAPQILILDHPAIGGIVTHCGWNSILESLNVSLPMITWPMFAEQFYNEKLLVDVLKIGVPVGAKVNKFWLNTVEEEVVKREEIVKAVEILMGNGQEGKKMRMRARKFGDAAKRTIEKGGYSYNNLIQLLDELTSLKIARELEKSRLDN
ncbi:uncharacterized protein UGT73P7 [Cicer arietinum]|uniref:uncharacterized protein UGT73P7 n=1 Tax=Cicer arietinum TaxID=3827 RepID=UPI003CC66ED1